MVGSSLQQYVLDGNLMYMYRPEREEFTLAVAAQLTQVSNWFAKACLLMLLSNSTSLLRVLADFGTAARGTQEGSHEPVKQDGFRREEG